MELTDMKEFRSYPADRLDQLAGELRATIQSLRFTVGTRQRTDVRTLRTVKRNLARLLTVRNAQ